MIFTFDELGINLPDYNGMRIDSVNALIINKAADYYKTLFGFDNDLDEDCFFDYRWKVDLVQRYIEIPDESLVIQPLYN